MQRALSILRSARFEAPLACPVALSQIRSRSGIDFQRARARAGFARGHLLEVVIYLPGGKGHLGETEAAEDLVRLLVGEELFERWIGSVLAAPTVRGGSLTVVNENSEDRSALPIEMLLDSVRAAIAGLKLGLTELEPGHVADRDDWFAFELSPEPAVDYAAQDDLLFCSTRVPELKKSFLRGEPFFSGRFSASGALFAYLKYDTAETSFEARIAERSKLEEADQRSPRRARRHHRRLRPRCALRLHRLWPCSTHSARGNGCCPALRALRISKRSWLLFCDSELETEYSPVYPDSPAPFRD